jgi:hypothetical protein
MKKEVANIWVAGLRSGKYKQGIGLLRSKDDHYCCLGVLADLAVTQKGVIRSLDKDYFTFDDYKECLPPKVVEWAELKNAHGFCPQIGQTLAELNDKHKTFAEIADLIEKNWERL